MQVDRAGKGDGAVVAGVGCPVEVDVRARHGERARRRHRAQIDLPAAHRQAGELGRAAHRALQVHRTRAARHRQRLGPVDRRTERDVPAARVAAHRHVGVQVHRAGEGDVAGLGGVAPCVQVDVAARHRDRARRRHRVQVDLVAIDCQARQRRRAAYRALQVHRARARIEGQILTAVDRRGEGDRAVGAVVVRVAVHAHRTGQRHRPGEGDVAVIAEVVPVQRDAGRARDRDRADGPHIFQRYRTSGHRQAGQRRRAAHRAAERHRTGAARHRQRPGPVDRRAERNVPAARAAAHRHGGGVVQVHRPGEGDVAALGAVAPRVQVDVRARHRDRARRRHRVQVDLAAIDCQARQRCRAADRALQVHRPAVRIEDQSLGTVDRRGEGDRAVGVVVVRVAVHAHRARQRHRPGEGDVAVVAEVVPIQRDAGRARDRDRAGGPYAFQRYHTSGDRQARELVRAAHRALQGHRPAARIERQRLGAGGRRVDRRGEGDVAVGGVIVRVAVHRHVGVQVDRAGEGDVAVVAVVGGSVQVDVRARHRDRAGRRHRVQVDLPTAHRQAGELRRAAHRAPQVHRTRAARHRQGLGPVDRRTERDVPAARVTAHRHGGAVVQVHRPGEGDVAVLGAVAPRVEVDVRPRHRDRARRRHRVQVDLAAIDCQARQTGDAAGRALQVHRTRARIEGQSLAAVDRRGEGDVPVRAVVVRVAVHAHRAGQRHHPGEGDVAVIAEVVPVQRDAGRARDRDRAHNLHVLQRHRTSGDRQARELVRAAHRALQGHRPAARIERQRLGAGGRRVDRRGEGDVAVGGVIVRVAVHRHVGVQVDRAGEGDVAVVAVVGGAVQVDVRARHGNRTHRRHRVQVDLTAGHRQAGQLGRAADGAGERHRTGPRRHRQGLPAVHRRVEADVPVGIVGIVVAVHHHVGVQVDRGAEVDIAVVTGVGRAVEVDVHAIDVDCVIDRNRVEIDLPAVHRQVRRLGRAADGAL